MKKLLIFALAIVPMLVMAQDDMYFTASKKPKQQTQVDRTPARVETLKPVKVVDYHSNSRSEDEYNRRYVYSGDYQNAGGLYADSLTAGMDSVDYANEYDLEDPELDYQFSRRLVRFHNPRIYALASPYYWDLYYGYGAWDYLYDPYYDPWYYHYGWRYGWTWGPWDCWYGGIWGWHHPYAWSYWGYGPGWHHPVHGGWHHGGMHNIVPRQFNSSRGHMAAGNRLRTNALGGNSVASRSNVMGNRTNVMGNRTNVIGNRTNVVGDRSRATEGRTSVTQRSNVTTRNNAQTPSRSNSDRVSSNRSSTNSNYTAPSRSSSTNSRSSAGSSRSSGFSGGGSYGGGSRGGGSFGGGGGSRGGGGRR